MTDPLQNPEKFNPDHSVPANPQPDFQDKPCTEQPLPTGYPPLPPYPGQLPPPYPEQGPPPYPEQPGYPEPGHPEPAVIVEQPSLSSHAEEKKRYRRTNEDDVGDACCNVLTCYALCSLCDGCCDDGCCDVDCCDCVCECCDACGDCCEGLCKCLAD